MKKIIVSIGVLLLSASAFSQTTNICDPNDSIKIFFGNGMFTDEYDADLSKLDLQNRIKPLLPEGVIVDYAVSYNHNEFAPLQIVEVVGQEGIDNWSSFFNWLSGVEIAPDWFQQKMETLASSVDQLNYVLDADLQKHVQVYKREILAGKKVIIVSHSQGNFYSNRAHGNVASESLGIVAVATPANFVAGGGPYTTLTNDIVMNAVRAFDPGTLPGNTTNSSSGESNGHAFSGSYLEGDISGPKIIGHILAKITALRSPLPNLSSGGELNIRDENTTVVDISISNSGGGVAKATTHDVYYAFGSLVKLGSVASPELAPGESFSTSVSFRDGGNFCVGNCIPIIVTDAPNTVEESTEADNCDLCWMTCKFLGELCFCGQIPDPL